MGPILKRIDIESMIDRLNLNIREERRGFVLTMLPGARIIDELEDILINLPSRLMSLERDSRQFESILGINRIDSYVLNNL